LFRRKGGFWEEGWKPHPKYLISCTGRVGIAHRDVLIAFMSPAVRPPKTIIFNPPFVLDL